MSYYRSTPPRGGWGGGEVLGLPPMTPVNRALMIACGATWTVQFLAWVLFRFDFSPWLGLVPALVVRGWLWQPATYIFLHSPQAITHVIFNVLVMWMLGGDLERYWGGRKYLQYWFVTGIGAGLCVTAASAWRPGVAGIPTIGASGAVFGLIVAYGTIFAERRLLWNFLFPIKARTMAWILFAVEFVSLLLQPGDGVSHLAHLGGAAVGWLYLKRAWHLSNAWRELKWAVKRRRFKVMPPDDRDRFIH
jgi:rhomboid family protein